MIEPKHRWNLVAGPDENPLILHSFTARGALKASRKAYRRLLKRYGALVAFGLMDVRLERA